MGIEEEELQNETPSGVIVLRSDNFFLRSIDEEGTISSLKSFEKC